MPNQFFIFSLFPLSLLLTFTIFHFSIVFSSTDDGFFGIFPEDYGEKSKDSIQLHEENKSIDQNTYQTLSTPSLITNNTANRHHFNIAITADWGCEKDTKKTVENIQNKDPELVLSAGDASYHKSSECWFDIIKPLKSKMKIAMGDHEYSDTTGGVTGVLNQYLKPLNLQKTYYSFDINNVHVVVIDPFIDYGHNSVQYQFIENDLKTASNNPNIDWTFIVESTPIYTSLAQHPGDSAIRDTYNPLFDRYSVDLVFTSDNHNYQRTFALKYNSEDGVSSNPIIADSNQNNYYFINDNNDGYDDINNKHKGVIYLIVGTGGRSLYPIKEQAPFVAKQDDKHFGFLNLDIDGKTLKGSFYANEHELPHYHYIGYHDNIIDEFTISKITRYDNNKGFNKL